jgi:hypothetical protein
MSLTFWSKNSLFMFYLHEENLKLSKQPKLGSSLLGMIRSGGINRLNPYPARDLID